MASRDARPILARWKSDSRRRITARDRVTGSERDAMRTVTSDSVQAAQPKPEEGRRRFLSQMAAGLFGAGAAVKIGRGTSAVSAWTGQASNSVLNQAKPTARGNDLRIVKVDPYIVRFSKDDRGQLTGNFCLLCRVETAEGIVGWGEGTNFPKVATIATEIEMNRSTVIGQSAWDIEKIWYDISRSRAAMHGSTVQSAISAIDIALWDIVGQKLGVPRSEERRVGNECRSRQARDVELRKTR